jgi:hypothetical protein
MQAVAQQNVNFGELRHWLKLNLRETAQIKHKSAIKSSDTTKT